LDLFLTILPISRTHLAVICIVAGTLTQTLLGEPTALPLLLFFFGGKEWGSERER